jgi:DNA-binding MarR family transcriptional regulator
VVDDTAEESLSEAFLAVARRLKRLSSQALEPLDITPGQSRGIRELSHHGTMRLSELSDHLHIAPRSTTEVVDALEERGLVARAPDPSDRRATLVSLTEHGERISQALRRARALEGDTYFAALSQDERADLSRILRKLRT